MPGFVGPAAQTLLAPSRMEPSAARKAKSVPRIETRYGVKAACRFAADADNRDRAGADRLEGVLQADRPVVGAVVVRHRDHVDPRRFEDVERGRRGAEVVALAGDSSSLASGVPRSVIADSRLTMVRSASARVRAMGPSAPSRVLEQRGQMQLEVHVPGERQRDRLTGLSALGARMACVAAGHLGRGRIRGARPSSSWSSSRRTR